MGNAQSTVAIIGAGQVARKIAADLGGHAEAVSVDEAVDGAGVSGFDPVRVGGLDRAVRIEMLGDLHEFGALGRVVTRTEALKAIWPSQPRTTPAVT